MGDGKVTCPWCGAKLRVAWVDYDYVAAECPDCGAHGPKVFSDIDTEEGMREAERQAMRRAAMRMEAEG